MSHFEQEIISSRLMLRALSLEDSNLIVSWRNNKEIKDFSFSKEEITLEGHRDWFKKTRNIRLDYLFLELQNLEPIGLVSLQKNKYDDQLRSYELSKYIGNKKYLGKGYALEATEALINYAFKAERVILIDPEAPDMEGVETIKHKATIGVPEIVSRLLQDY